MREHCGWLRLAKHPDLIRRDLRVFLALRSYCDQQGCVGIAQKDIARDLHMYRQEVSKSIMHLLHLGIVTRKYTHKLRGGPLIIHPEYL